MNLIRKDPRHPKYNEFHDGEHEYNPLAMKGGGRKSIAFSGKALASGLELVVAAVAVVVVVAVLAGLSVSTSPVSITHDSAVINVSVHDNSDGLPVTYTLLPDDDSGNIVAQGLLEGDSSTLRFTGLTEKTAYVLTYHAPNDEGLAQIGEFRFTTGSLPVNQPTQPPTTPEPTTQPPTTPEPTTQPPTTPEPTTQPPTTPEPTTVPPTTPEPTTPPPTTPKPTTPPPTTPEPTTPPPTTPEPTTPPVKEPTALTPEVTNVTFIPANSGEEAQAYYDIEQRFPFANIPSENFDISVGGDAKEYGFETVVEGDTLYVYVYSYNTIAGQSMSTEVTVVWDTGETCTGSNSIIVPMLGTAELTVTKNNADGSYTFNIVLNADPDSEPMSCIALLYSQGLSGDSLDNGISLNLVRQADGTYTASYTTVMDTVAGPFTSFVSVSGIWEAAGSVSEATTPPSVYAYFDYVPAEL